LLPSSSAPVFSPNFLFTIDGIKCCSCGRQEFEESLKEKAGDDSFLLQDGRIVELNQVLPDLMVYVSRRVRGGSLLELNGDSLDSSYCEIQVGDVVVEKSPTFYLEWLSVYLLSAAKSVSLKGSLGEFNSSAESQLLRDNLSSYRNRAGVYLLTKIKLDPDFWGDGASGYILSFVEAVGGAIDLMVEALRKISSDVNLFGVLKLKRAWSGMQREEWFLSFFSWNNP
jgi:hypothetical protein